MLIAEANSQVPAKLRTAWEEQRKKDGELGRITCVLSRTVSTLMSLSGSDHARVANTGHNNTWYLMDLMPEVEVGVGVDRG